MQLEVKRQSSSKLGTHYGVFLNEVLIHYEFSRSSADKIVEAMASGAVLYEVLFEQITNFSARKNRSEIELLNYHINKQCDKIKKLEQDVAKLKKIDNQNKESPWRFPFSTSDVKETNK